MEDRTNKRTCDVLTCPRGKILVVDDDADDLDSVQTLLQTWGFDVEVAGSGEDAICTLAETDYDLMLTDVRMPRISGLDLLAYCREQRPSMGVVLLTAAPHLQDAVGSMKAGACDYLEKPVDFTTLERTVEEALEKRRADPGALVNTLKMDGSVAGGYRVIKTLGEGTGGIVLLVEKGGRLFAMKMLRVWGKSDARERQLPRFLQEARILSRLNHPGVVGIHEHGITPGRDVPFMVMEFVDGHPLTDHIEAGDLSTAERLSLIHQIAGTLAAVHDVGILHRDVKPGNVMVTRGGDAKLTDFGVARLAGSSLTLDGMIIGSPSYMAPEAYRHEELDCRADIFSLGVLSYELLTGQRPFKGDAISEIGFAVETEVPVMPVSLSPGLPPEVDPIVSRMLAKEREERYQTAADVAADLKPLLAP